MTKDNLKITTTKQRKEMAKKKKKKDPLINYSILATFGFPGNSVVKKKNPPANARDMGSIPQSGRSHGEGNGNSLQYSSLGNPMKRGA